MTDITKVVQHDDVLEIHYTSASKLGGIDEHIRRSRDPADPDLYKALQKLRGHVVAFCEFGFKWEEGLRIRSVKMTDGGVVIKAEKRLKGVEELFEFSTPTLELKPALATDLDALFDHVERFLQGIRGQLDMFGQEGKKTPAQKKDLPAVLPTRHIRAAVIAT